MTIILKIGYISRIAEKPPVGKFAPNLVLVEVAVVITGDHFLAIGQGTSNLCRGGGWKSAVPFDKARRR